MSGYKQTELGEIPEDWQISSMSTMTSLMTNGFVGTAKRHYTDREDGVLYIQGYNITPGGFNLNGVKSVTKEFHLQHKKSCLREGDLLTVQTGDIGETTVIPSKLAGANCHALIISRFKPDRFSSEFFCYYLNSEQGRARLREIETGTTMKHINVGDLVNFEIAHPASLSEQTAIANALSDTDALIKGLEKLINKKRAIKTAAMQQLLTGKTRLPGFDKHPNGKPKGMKQTELGEIPEDWQIANLSEIGTTIIGLTYSPKDVSETGTLVLRSSNIQRNRLAFNDNVFVDMDLPRRVIVREGDILICVRNGSKKLIGKCALIDKNTSGAAFGAFMSIFRSKVSRFVFQQMQTDSFQSQINEVMGATINQLTNKDLASFKISLPSNHDEQAAIGNILSEMDDEITALEHRLGKTRDIKQGMMQELLTGRTRLL